MCLGDRFSAPGFTKAIGPISTLKEGNEKDMGKRGEEGKKKEEDEEEELKRATTASRCSRLTSSLKFHHRELVTWERIKFMVEVIAKMENNEDFGV